MTDQEKRQSAPPVIHLPDSQPRSSAQAATAPAPPPNSINVNNLGYFLDGWADLVEGMGDKVDEVRTGVLKELKIREMPEIEVSWKTGYVSLASNNRRSYLISTTSPGATTAIYIGKHGKDLFASWKTFIRAVPNVNAIGVIIFIAAILAVINTLVLGGSFFGWFLSTIFLSLLIAFFVGLAGRVLKGSFTSFFFIEPNIFDADDITAMSLAAHKSLFRALDGAGIDVSKLRLKRDFKGGRRDEDV